MLTEKDTNNKVEIFLAEKDPNNKTESQLIRLSLQIAAPAGTFPFCVSVGSSSFRPVCNYVLGVLKQML